MKPFFVLIQYCLAHHLCSRIIGKLIRVKTPWIKNAVLRWFIKRYQVDLSEAKIENYQDYPTFNAFFTRALKDTARKIASNTVISPADGLVSAIGSINNGRLFQAKGRDYTLNALLGGDNALADRFQHGQFATIYLSPKDYHCVHMPLNGQLVKTRYVPGRLFSVNTLTAQHVPDLFARNERLICEFDTAQGKLAVIFVGAMIVAGIETVFDGIIAPAAKHQIQSKTFDHIPFSKGDKLGHFFLGSTVIVLAEKALGLKAGLFNQNIRFGEALSDS